MGFREFDRNDWDAFAGCESKNPMIADSDFAVVVIDNKSVNVMHSAGVGSLIEHPEGVPIYNREFDSPEQANDVAYVLDVMAATLSLSGYANLLKAVMGELVGIG